MRLFRTIFPADKHQTARRPPKKSSNNEMPPEHRWHFIVELVPQPNHFSFATSPTVG